MSADTANAVQDLVREGRLNEAASILSQAVPSPTLESAATILSRRLTEAGAAVQAVEAAAGLAARPEAGAVLLDAHALALKACGRMDEAVAFHQRATAADPTSVVMEHNLAATLGDGFRAAEAEAAARRAMAKGGDKPETWLVLARALLAQDKLDAAQDAFVQTLTRRPLYEAAHRELAELIWMRTADLAAASHHLDAALTRAPERQDLLLAKARLVGHAAEAADALAVVRGAADDTFASGGLLIAASQFAARVAPALAVSYAERAAALAGEAAWPALAESYLAAGRVEDAAQAAQALVRRNRFDQGALAVLAAAWRLMGHERYGWLYDYAVMVRAETIDVPDGWSSLDAYLADLAAGLRAMHPLKTHPIGQSLRHGSQTNQSLLRSSHPAIRALRQAVDGPIRRYMQMVRGAHGPLGARLGQAQDWDFSGLWSVRLRPGGFHIDHMHPQGWLSSALYVALPADVAAGGKQGWIKFGQPGVATQPALEAEHYVQPKPGLLALFPSYMWHGTVPFQRGDERLTCAFDVVPV